MRTKEELTREVEDRNKLRADVGLPLVPVAKKVQKLYAAELRQDFLDWSDRRPLWRWLLWSFPKSRLSQLELSETSEGVRSGPRPMRSSDRSRHC